MSIQSATPYFILNGKAKQAIELYQRALGAKLETLQRFGDVQQSCPDAQKDRVMHAVLRVGNALLMMSDGPVDGPRSDGGVEDAGSPRPTPPSATAWALTVTMLLYCGRAGDRGVMFGLTYSSPRHGTTPDLQYWLTQEVGTPVVRGRSTTRRWPVEHSVVLPGPLRGAPALTRSCSRDHSEVLLR